LDPARPLAIDAVDERERKTPLLSKEDPDLLHTLLCHEPVRLRKGDYLKERSIPAKRGVELGSVAAGEAGQVQALERRKEDLFLSGSQLT